MNEWMNKIYSMYDEYKTKANKNWTKDNIESQHTLLHEILATLNLAILKNPYLMWL